MDHGRERSWEEREDCAAWPDPCYVTWSTCTALGGVNGLQQQQPCSFCPPLPSFRKFAPGHINAENRDLQMLLLAATSSCHGDGSCAQSTRLRFFCLMPARLQEKKEAVGLLSHYPGFLMCRTSWCYTLDLFLNPTHLFDNSGIGTALWIRECYKLALWCIALSVLFYSVKKKEERD